MAHTVSFKLQKSATTFAAGDSTGFGIRGGVQYQDPKTKEKKYTNYEAAIFAKSPAQIDFYSQCLVEGALVVVSSEKLFPRQYESQSGGGIIINMLNARLENAMPPQGAAPQQQPAQRQTAHQPAQQSIPQQPAGFDSFDDDIPF